MLTLGIRYLTGCVVATNVSNRRRVEWPPHPGRVFMALAAAHFETGEDPTERAALEWLEAQPAPQIHAPEHSERPVVTQYVPVNDQAGPSKAPIQSLTGLMRKRQPRVFARAWLRGDTVYLSWPDSEPHTHLTALDRLCGKVSRIGHSISLVYVWASQSTPNKPVNWIPDEKRACDRFRISGPGLLRYLERQFNKQETDVFLELSLHADDDSEQRLQRTAKNMLRERFQNQPPLRLRPELSLSHGYAPPLEAAASLVAGTVFDPRLLVFALRRVDGPYRHLDLSATLQLTSRFREALLQQLGANIPEVLSGHCGAAPSRNPHVAFLPLPFVGSKHAHGGILGVALALPRGIGVADKQQLLRALAYIRQEGLKLGPLGRWNLDAETGTAPLTLRDRAWTAFPEGARMWATVTPYVYDRHAKAKDKVSYQLELARSVTESWQRVKQGLDVSVEVTITPVSPHLGTPTSQEFPRLMRKDGGEYRHTHVILAFDRPVVGPVILGAGRFRGYGICRPLEVEA